MEDPSFSSNSIRLSGREWLIAVIAMLVIALLLPTVWGHFQKYYSSLDNRLPYELSSDYWLYEDYCKEVAADADVLLVGDSVIWGHYVSRDNTLSHYLNTLANEDKKFANLGLDGAHPAALEGLLKYYGKAITNKKVVLHFNPLWMSSTKHDLQTDKEYDFNHSELVPQFKPEIPCYRATLLEKLTAIVKRHNSLQSWADHINITCFENLNLPVWTIENPYNIPAILKSFQMPQIDTFEESTDSSVSIEAGLQWVELDTSLQWLFFSRTVQLMKERGNKVFVLVGPFNEHRLDENSFETYNQVKNDIEIWLRDNKISYYMPSVLPLQLYNDTSHPNSRGYELLAEQIFENESFISWYSQQ